MPKVLGLPRPTKLLKGRKAPVPYTQAPGRWGVLDDKRAARCTERSLCGHCGLPVDSGAVITSLRESREYASPRLAQYTHQDLTRLEVLDDLAFHERCAVMVMAHCPHLRDEGAMFESRPYERGMT